jgi:excisionase family DNA binding protein
MSKNKLLTIKDVAKHLQVGERTAYRYVKIGRIKAVKIGGWRISKQDLQSFIKRSSNNHK